MSDGDHRISVTPKTGTLLTLSERERKELLDEVDRKLAELDERRGDAPADLADS
jgi:hypothetical protein